MLRVAKEAVLGTGDIARNLCHPSIVGVGCDASNVDRAGGNVDEEEDVVRDEPFDRVHLNAQEVGRCQAFPVGFEKWPMSPRAGSSSIARQQAARTTWALFTTSLKLSLPGAA